MADITAIALEQAGKSFDSFNQAERERAAYLAQQRGWNAEAEQARLRNEAQIKMEQMRQDAATERARLSERGARARTRIGESGASSRQTASDSAAMARVKEQETGRTARDTLFRDTQKSIADQTDQRLRDIEKDRLTWEKEDSERSAKAPTKQLLFDNYNIIAKVLDDRGSSVPTPEEIKAMDLDDVQLLWGEVSDGVDAAKRETRAERKSENINMLLRKSQELLTASAVVSSRTLIPGASRAMKGQLAAMILQGMTEKESTQFEREFKNAVAKGDTGGMGIMDPDDAWISFMNGDWDTNPDETEKKTPNFIRLDDPMGTRGIGIGATKFLERAYLTALGKMYVHDENGAVISDGNGNPQIRVEYQGYNLVVDEMQRHKTLNSTIAVNVGTATGLLGQAMLEYRAGIEQDLPLAKHVNFEDLMMPVARIQEAMDNADNKLKTLNGAGVDTALDAAPPPESFARDVKATAKRNIDRTYGRAARGDWIGATRGVVENVREAVGGGYERARGAVVNPYDKPEELERPMPGAEAATEDVRVNRENPLDSSSRLPDADVPVPGAKLPVVPSTPDIGPPTGMSPTSFLRPDATGMPSAPRYGTKFEESLDRLRNKFSGFSATT